MEAGGKGEACGLIQTRDDGGWSQHGHISKVEPIGFLDKDFLANWPLRNEKSQGCLSLFYI